MLRNLLKKYSYVLVFAVAIIFICITLNVVFPESSHADQTNIEAISITIHAGDTLWSISKQYHQQLGVSVQEYIYHIKVMNQLDSDDIYQGQILSIPLSIS